MTMTGNSQPRWDVEPWLRDGPAHYGHGATALYCDFENLVLGAGSCPAGPANPVPAKAVTWLCRWYRNASIRAAYANWADPISVATRPRCTTTTSI